ncbi:MAG: tetratricopeptide repeat protein [Desulfuromonadales bacterium]|nr:tetratricopeptide repeat protein [Desulfuromonadales bacterium]
MAATDLNGLITRGVQAMEEGNTLIALLYFEDATILRRIPMVLSSLGYCLVREHRQVQKGIGLCLEAMQKEPQNALHYLNLGRIYLLAGQKSLALQTFRRGLRCQRNPQIIEELKRLGVRKRPVFSGLKRDHPLNRFFGLILARLGVR